MRRRPCDLLAQEVGGHAVNAAGQIVRLGDPRRDQRLVYEIGCIPATGGIGNEAGLTGNDHLIALNRATLYQIGECTAKRNLAVLPSITDCHVEVVTAAGDRRSYCPTVARVDFIRGVPGGEPESDRRDAQVAEGAKMSGRRYRPIGPIWDGANGPVHHRHRMAFDARGEACGARRRGTAGQRHQAAPTLAAPAACLASFFWRSSALRAIRLNVLDRPIAFLTSRKVSPAISR